MNFVRISCPVISHLLLHDARPLFPIFFFSIERRANLHPVKKVNMNEVRFGIHTHFRDIQDNTLHDLA